MRKTICDVCKKEIEANKPYYAYIKRKEKINLARYVDILEDTEAAVVHINCDKGFKIMGDEK